MAAVVTMAMTQPLQTSTWPAARHCLRLLSTMVATMAATPHKLMLIITMERGSSIICTNASNSQVMAIQILQTHITLRA